MDVVNEFNSMMNAAMTTGLDFFVDGDETTEDDSSDGDGGDMALGFVVIGLIVIDGPLPFGDALAVGIGTSYLSSQVYTSRGNPKPVLNTYAKDGGPPYWRNPGGVFSQFVLAFSVGAVILDRITPKMQNSNEIPLDHNSKNNPSDMIIPISDPNYWNKLTDKQKIGYMNNVLNNN